jgi:hypothetical protein
MVVVQSNTNRVKRSCNRLTPKTNKTSAEGKMQELCAKWDGFDGQNVGIAVKRMSKNTQTNQ